MQPADVTARRAGTWVRALVLLICIGSVRGDDGSARLMLQSDGVTIRSGVGTARGRHALRHLRALRLVLHEQLPVLPARALRPVYAEIAAAPKAFRRLAPRPAVAAGSRGAYWTGRLRGNIVVDGGEPTETEALLAHEFLHAILDQAAPGAPAWLQEGLAEYWSTFWSNGLEWEAGRPVEAYAARVRRSALQEWNVWEQEPPAPKPGARERKEGFHARSWLVVHYLMDPRHGLRDRFVGWIEALRWEEEGPMALPEALGVAVDALLERLHDYARKGSFHVLQGRLSRRVSEGAIRSEVVDRGAGTFHRVVLLADAGRLREARKALRRLRRVEGAGAYVEAGAAYLSWIEGRPPRDLGPLSAGGAAADDPWLSWLELHLRGVPGARQGPAGELEALWDRVLAWEPARLSVALEPRRDGVHLEAWTSLARRRLEEARRADPSNPGLALLAVRWRLLEGRREEARRLLDAMAAEHPESPWVRRAKALLAAAGSD